MEEEKELIQKVNKEVEEKINNLIEKGIDAENLELLYKLVDIHKDLKNEEYWKKKEEVMKMNYRGYSEGGYSAGGSGGYSEGGYGAGNYGRRGVPGSGRGRYRGGRGSGRYRGEEMMDEMMYHYVNYSEEAEYGAEGVAVEALKKLMESAYEYFKELKENANSPEEMKIMEHYFKKMGQM